MRPENHNPNPGNPEAKQDLAWIRENQALFWLVAAVGYEEIGRGALMVDLVHQPLGHGHPFSYYGY